MHSTDFRSPKDFGSLHRSKRRGGLHREWVRTLSDLVERRLLLIFDPRLNQSRLRELATLLADEGVMHSDQIDSEVKATAARLRQVYGIDVGGSCFPVPGRALNSG